MKNIALKTRYQMIMVKIIKFNRRVASKNSRPINYQLLRLNLTDNKKEK